MHKLARCAAVANVVALPKIDNGNTKRYGKKRIVFSLFSLVVVVVVVVAITARKIIYKTLLKQSGKYIQELVEKYF